MLSALRQSNKIFKSAYVKTNSRTFTTKLHHEQDLVKVEFDKDDAGKHTSVAIIKLHSPKSLNAMTIAMGEQFTNVITTLTNDKSIRSVVITGEGKAFSAGGDLQYITDRANDSPHNNEIMMRQFYQRFLNVRNLHCPVVSAINGSAIGAGLCLALACDLKIAAKDAKLGVTFSALGFHPGMGASHYLPKLVGNQLATKMLLLGDLITGEEAKQHGLVLDAVETDKVMPVALALARRIADQSIVSVQTTIRTLRNQQDHDLQQNLWREASAQAICYAAEDVKEGVAAIKEKRKPVFHK